MKLKIAQLSLIAASVIFTATVTSTRMEARADGIGPERSTWISRKLETYLNSSTFQKILGFQTPIHVEVLSADSDGATFSLNGTKFTLHKQEGDYLLNFAIESTRAEAIITPTTHLGVTTGADIEIIAHPIGQKELVFHNRFEYLTNPTELRTWLEEVVSDSRPKSAGIAMTDVCGGHIDCVIEILPMAILILVLLIVFSPAILVYCLIAGSC